MMNQTYSNFLRGVRIEEMRAALHETLTRHGVAGHDEVDDWVDTTGRQIAEALLVAGWKPPA